MVGLDLDGEYSGTLPSGNGLEGGDFVIQFSVDAPTRQLPVPLTAIEPLGSLIYQTPYASSGVIAPGSDTDDFTIELDANQTVTLLVGASAGLQPTVSLFDPSDNQVGSTATAPAPGSEAVFQATLIPGAGTYRISVGSASGQGLYSVQLIVNAAVEDESHGGSQNDSTLEAQPLDASFLDLGGGSSRGAVLGSVGALLVGSNQSAQFLEVDPLTGAATVIADGVNNYRGYTDLARNPVTGLLYGSGARNDSGLYIVDPATGAGSLVGYAGSGMHSLAWSPEGTTLYGVQFSRFRDDQRHDGGILLHSG